MQAKVVFGNAVVEGAKRWGWFIGHFITPSEDPRSTEDLEVKWAVHKAGDSRTQWAVNNEAATLSILIHGRFRLQFEDTEIVLSQEGDYVQVCRIVGLLSLTALLLPLDGPPSPAIAWECRDNLR